MLTGHPVTVDLNTAHGNFARGIHLQANVRLAVELSRDDVLALCTEHTATVTTASTSSWSTHCPSGAR